MRLIAITLGVNVLKIKYINTADLTPYESNSRTHSEFQIQQITASIKEFGFTNPILVDELGGIIAGHGRLNAAQILGLDKVPTIILKDLSEAQKKAYVIADNKIALNSGWNEEILKKEMLALKISDFDIDSVGFTESELSGLFLEIQEGINNADDEWTNMPEFDQPDATSYRHVIVHFENDDDIKEFFSIIGQTDTGKTKSTWFPEKQRNDTESKRYD